MKSLKLKLFEYRKTLASDQIDVVNIISEHIDLCDDFSEKEIYNGLNKSLEPFKYYESVNTLLNEVDTELSNESLLYNLKDLYSKIKRKGDTFLYENALNKILECIDTTNDEDRKIKILSELKLYTWINEIKSFLYEMSSLPQDKHNYKVSNSSKVEDVYSVVLQVKEGYLTYVAKNWFLLNNEGINTTLLENHIQDEVQLRKLRLLEQALQEAIINDNTISFNIAEDFNISFNTQNKEITLNDNKAEDSTTLESLFNSPIVPFLGKGYYPILNETFNNLDKFMKIDTVKHVYNLAVPSFECYVFNFNGNIAQYRMDSHIGSSYYKFENAMPLVENVLQELGADLTFFYENLLSDEIKLKKSLENEERKVLEKIEDIEKSILSIKNEGDDFMKENVIVQKMFNQLLANKHKHSQKLKEIKDKKAQIYK